jgi:hypothetical protein
MYKYFLRYLGLVISVLLSVLFITNRIYFFLIFPLAFLIIIILNWKRFQLIADEVYIDYSEKAMSFHYSSKGVFVKDFSQLRTVERKSFALIKLTFTSRDTIYFYPQHLFLYLFPDPKIYEELKTILSNEHPRKEAKLFIEE